MGPMAPPPMPNMRHETTSTTTTTTTTTTTITTTTSSSAPPTPGVTGPAEDMAMDMGFGSGYGYGYGYGSSFILCLLDQIQSAKLTSVLTADEILQAEDIIEKFGLLIINIEATIE